ncbi:MAG: murein hydrolase activator EnvC family protein [Nitriliruptoraceae bacterium]
MGVVVPPIGASADEEELDRIEAEIDEVEDAMAEVQQRLETIGEEQERLRARIAELESETDELERQLSGLRDERDELEERMATRIRTAFKHGDSLEPVAVFLGSEDPSSALNRAELIEHVVAGDQVRSEELVAAQQRVTAAEEELAERAEALEEAEQRQRELGEEMQQEYDELEAAEAELSAEAQAERERIEEERRERERREAAQEQAEQEAEQAQQDAGGDGSGGSAASTSGGMACPLDQPRHFVDSWGAPRSGGRAHRGTDLMGPLGTPVRAIVDGVWDIQSPGANAGLWAILRGRDGNDYWYLHLDSHTVSDGAQVSAGQQVGTNGSTGNAVAGAEHVHFELHPGGGSAINPYPTLRGACG